MDNGVTYWSWNLESLIVWLWVAFSIILIWKITAYKVWIIIDNKRQHIHKETLCKVFIVVLFIGINYEPNFATLVKRVKLCSLSSNRMCLGIYERMEAAPKSNLRKGAGKMWGWKVTKSVKEKEMAFYNRFISKQHN